MHAKENQERLYSAYDRRHKYRYILIQECDAAGKDTSDIGAKRRQHDERYQRSNRHSDQRLQDSLYHIWRYLLRKAFHIRHKPYGQDNRQNGRAVGKQPYRDPEKADRFSCRNQSVPVGMDQNAADHSRQIRVTAELLR